MRLSRYLSATRLNYEMIFVDDASPDNCRSEIDRCCEELQRRGVSFKKIFHTTNMGRGAAVSAGFMIAEGKIVGFIDIDLEHKMDSLLSMYLRLDQGECDVVTGKRLMQKAWAYPARSITSHIYRWIMRLILGMPVTDSETGLKLFRRDPILPVLESCHSKHWFWDTEILHRAYRSGLRIIEHKIVFDKLPHKKSSVRLLRDSIRQLRELWAHWWRIRREN